MSKFSTLVKRSVAKSTLFVFPWARPYYVEDDPQHRYINGMMPWHSYRAILARGVTRAFYRKIGPIYLRVRYALTWLKFQPQKKHLREVLGDDHGWREGD